MDATAISRLEGMPDLNSARMTSCDCGLASLYVVDDVSDGIAELVLYCRQCNTAVSLAASGWSIDKQGGYPRGR